MKARTSACTNDENEQVATMPLLASGWEMLAGNLMFVEKSTEENLALMLSFFRPERRAP